MIEDKYYKKNICEVCCRKHKTEDCEKCFKEEYVKREKLCTKVCENYSRDEKEI